MFAGHVIDGAWASWTVTVNEQLAISAVQVTVVVPAGKNEPDAGLHTGVQSPVTLGVG